MTIPLSASYLFTVLSKVTASFSNLCRESFNNSWNHKWSPSHFLNQFGFKDKYSAHKHKHVQTAATVVLPFCVLHYWHLPFSLSFSACLSVTPISSWLTFLSFFGCFHLAIVVYLQWNHASSVEQRAIEGMQVKDTLTQDMAFTAYLTIKTGN